MLHRIRTWAKLNALIVSILFVEHLVLFFWWGIGNYGMEFMGLVLAALVLFVVLPLILFLIGLLVYNFLKGTL